ncbi:hypothetical protein MSG28_010347 [Choristoneura fumiferana]|uniref:Uncharacterized protein n=1 Tax=Choristoneura fumiferana TaxID=7141 RepID=A0ACC0KKX4_CHOFU|nr:hypothetical protein MSG28_010347 [Choristoneura fumiferana]
MSFPKRQNRPPVWLANLLSSVYSDKIPYLGHVAIDCGPPIGEGILLRVETAVASQISGVGNSSTVDRSSAISSDRYELFLFELKTFGKFNYRRGVWYRLKTPRGPPGHRSRAPDAAPLRPGSRQLSYLPLTPFYPTISILFTPEHSHQVVIDQALEKVPWVRRQFLAEYVRRSAELDSTSNSENESEPPAPLPYSGLQSQEDTHKALWTCYEELASTKQPEIEEPKSPIAIELDRYIADSLLMERPIAYHLLRREELQYEVEIRDAKAKDTVE